MVKTRRRSSRYSCAGRSTRVAYFFVTRICPSTGADVNTSVGTVQITSSWNVVSAPPVLVTVAVHPIPGLDGHSGAPS